jgi:hypothetical protein
MIAVYSQRSCATLQYDNFSVSDRYLRSSRSNLNSAVVENYRAAEIGLMNLSYGLQAAEHPQIDCGGAADLRSSSGRSPPIKYMSVYFNKKKYTDRRDQHTQPVLFSGTSMSDFTNQKVSLRLRLDSQI